MKLLRSLLCLILITSLCGCSVMNRYSIEQVEQEYAAIKELASNSETTTQQLSKAYVSLFKKLARGDRSQTGQFAEFMRNFVPNSAEFSEDEVFDLAENHIQFFQRMTKGNMDHGIQNIRLAGSAVEISYAGTLRYSVRAMESDEEWYKGDYLIPYDGSLGQYRAMIHFYDFNFSDAFSSSMPPWEVHKLINLFSKYNFLKIRCVNDPDHGCIIYIGSDTPFTVEEVEITTLAYPLGTITVPLISGK